MKSCMTAVVALVMSTSVYAAKLDVPVDLIDADGVKKPIGTITISETSHGLLFSPHLTDLSPGVHGFHLHEHPSCESAEQDGKLVPALAAGGHYDPHKTGKHLGPYDDHGHLGDLPALYVTADGKADYPVLAPRLKSLSEVKERSLMIHAGGDNYSDEPMALGGGGARIACGVIK